MRYFINHFEMLIGARRYRGKEFVWLTADAASALVMFIGVITCAGYIFNIPRLHDGWVSDSSDMALPTAICFVLVGFVLLTIHRGCDNVPKA